MKTAGQFLALFVFLVTACGGDSPLQPFEPEGLQPSRLQLHGEPVRVSIPPTATAGVSFEVAIETYGGGCVEAGPTSVKLIGGRLDIRPLDDFPDPDAVCTADVRLIDHSISFTVDVAMTLEVAVYGVRVTAAGREDTTVTGTIEVGGG